MKKNNFSRDVEKYIVIYANSARKKRGLSLFKSNKGLIKVARSHSRLMANAKKIWHGEGVYQTKNAVSYSSFWDFIKSLFLRGASGENVGLMFKGNIKKFKKPIKTSKDIALAQHKSWMRSPGHRKNLLNPDFSLIGVGVVRKHNGYYCTQLFYG